MRNKLLEILHQEKSLTFQKDISTLKNGSLLTIIRDNISEILESAQDKKDNLCLGMLYGSVARNEQLPFSDIDIETYSLDSTSSETFFHWNGFLVTFYKVPIEILFNDFSKPSSLVWYYQGFVDSKLIFEKEGYFQKVKIKLEEEHDKFQSIDSESKEENFLYLCRRLIEYRRKVYNASHTQEKLYLMHASKNFVDTFLTLKYLSLGISIKSERDLYTNFAILGNGEIRTHLETCLDITQNSQNIEKSVDALYNKGIDAIKEIKWK